MKKYKFQVWYNYIVDGEMENDFEIFEIEAMSSEHAKMKIHEKYFRSHMRIPFKFEPIEDEKNYLTKMMLYNLTNPFKNLN